MRRFATLTVLVGLLVGGWSGLTPAQSADTAPYCGIWWGSLPEQHRISSYTSAMINDLRGGRHGCFDRLVVDLGPGGSSRSLGYLARYVPEVPDIETGGSIPIAGGAILSVVVNAAAHDEDLNPTYLPDDRLHALDVTGFTTLRQVGFLGTFEGRTEIVIGVRARLPFRVFVLDGPGDGSRLVIDIAHRW